MIKIGHLVHGTVIKILPDYESYLVLIGNTEILSVLPNVYAGQPYRIGDTLTAAIFQFAHPVPPEKQDALIEGDPQVLRFGQLVLKAGPGVFDGSQRVPWVVLSQKNHQYIRRIMESVLAPLSIEGKILVRRAASVRNGAFFKVAVEGLNGEDPVKLCLPFLPQVKPFTSATVTIVRYSKDLREYITSALAPGPADQVRVVILHSELKEAQVIVDPAYLGLFLGKHGANVSSASKLTGVAIKIIPSAVSSERKKRDLLAITGV